MPSQLLDEKVSNITRFFAYQSVTTRIGSAAINSTCRARSGDIQATSPAIAMRNTRW